MMGDELWSPQEAARATGFHEETIRSWTRGDSPAIRREEAWVGRRRVIRLHREEVLREARARGRGIVPEGHDFAIAGSDGAEPPDDYTVTLEEILTRRRIIDEHRDEIEELQRKIIAQQREIEILLTSPRRVPNH